MTICLLKGRSNGSFFHLNAQMVFLWTVAAVSGRQDVWDDVLCSVFCLLRRFGASPLRARSTPSPTSTLASRCFGTWGRGSCRSRWGRPITSSPAAPTAPWRWGSSPTASASPIATTRTTSRTMSNSTYEKQEVGAKQTSTQMAWRNLSSRDWRSWSGYDQNQDRRR